MVRVWLSVIVVFMFLLSSCLPEQQVAKNNYFDLDSLLERQVMLLSNADPELAKSVRIGREVEQDKLHFSKEEWTKELSAFSQINPKSASYVNAFEVRREGEKVIFDRKGFSGQGLNTLELTYLEDELIAIYGRHYSETSVYTMSQEMSMSLGNQKLASYSIKGYQKMIYMDSTKFEITVDILD